jgi:hypothetical protein
MDKDKGKGKEKEKKHAPAGKSGTEAKVDDGDVEMS